MRLRCMHWAYMAKRHPGSSCLSWPIIHRRSRPAKNQRLDLGYVTIRPDLRVAVSRELRDDYANGRVYYELDGRIQLPPDPGLQPSPRRWPGTTPASTGARRPTAVKPTIAGGGAVVEEPGAVVATRATRRAIRWGASRPRGSLHHDRRSARETRGGRSAVA